MKTIYADQVEAAIEFIARVAKQKPEKPDYWNSCGQCANNISDAEDIIESASQLFAPNPQARSGTDGESGK